MVKNSSSNSKAAPKPRFMMLGKSKWVHVVYTKAWDAKNSECQQVRKYQVADKIKPSAKGLSPEAASALDPCPNCEPMAVIKAMESPESKKAKGKAATSDTIDRVRAEQKPNKAKAKPKAEAAPKQPGKQKMVKSGPKSVGGDAEKAAILQQFAEDNGWSVVITEDKPGLKFVAKRGNETITCWFDGGKYDLVRVGYIEVEGSDWQGKLRAAHACRRQMAGSGRDKPHPKPGLGRSAPRGKREEPTPETESPEDARKRLPFLMDDDDLTIIDGIKGKTLRWRNGVSGEVEEAQLPDDVGNGKRPKIALTINPTNNRRILSFFEVAGFDSATGKEMYGPERAVALDRMIRVL